MTATSLPTPVGRQREVLYLPSQGHVVVLGTAGSGKTTLAILRSLFLSDSSTDHSGRTLLVTFNRCLVTYMEALMSGTTQYSVDVRNYHHFARGYLANRGKFPWKCINSKDERTRQINTILSRATNSDIQSPILERSETFIDEEFEWIQQHGIADENAYVDETRAGRATTRVTRNDRPVLFELYRRYLDERRRVNKLYDWCDLASAVRTELNSDRGERRYRHVIIDEGQDFSPEMLRSLALSVPRDGSLTFFGDIAQQIYGHRMSWRSAGLSARRIWRFEENYRNTKQVSRLAIALAKMPHFPDNPDLVEPKAPAADGPRPYKRAFPNESEELAFVVQHAQRLARTGTVAVLFRTRDQETVFRKRRGVTRLHRELLDWPPAPGLFYGTYHSAKGLEFDTVFLPLLSDTRWLHPTDVGEIGEAESAARDARLLYVGITRARSNLIMTYVGRLTRLLPAEPGLYQV